MKKNVVMKLLASTSLALLLAGCGGGATEAPVITAKPMNTGGGQISAGQAACSSHNLIEAVRQLMGEGGERPRRGRLIQIPIAVGQVAGPRA